ncbi:MAG: hypothetical protein HQK83_18115 [Fibrobacteria bacterium]|nr:hypothetical protein [Fibrobacteria bacterium]
MMSEKHWLFRTGVFLSCCFFVIVFIWFLAPAAKNFSFLKAHFLFIEDRGIDANAMYYTEIEEFSEAETNMVHSLEYPPKK